MPNVLFLCAGFGTRLERDLKESNLKNLVGVPKALLPLNQKPLLEYWLEIIGGHKPYIICNQTHKAQFDEWAKKAGFDQKSIFSNGVVTNETRSGSVKDLHLAIQHFGLQNDDLIVVAGDTLLKKFDFAQFVLDSTLTKSSVVVYSAVTDQECFKSGVLETTSEDGIERVTGFLEKPGPQNTASRKGCPCFYFLHPSSMGLLKVFLDEKKGHPLSDIDASGRWIEWLIHKTPVYALSIAGRLDIGGLATYMDAENYLLENAL
ncbi:hypothetical protein HDV01_007744 [Terramyces sp. JEL0728]|nr:hypothetical protein HDV01_007744 [Terramyces sp. JEL0728]